MTIPHFFSKHFKNKRITAKKYSPKHNSRVDEKSVTVLILLLKNDTGCLWSKNAKNQLFFKKMLFFLFERGDHLSKKNICSGRVGS